jgi:STAS domain-containing protein
MTSTQPDGGRWPALNFERAGVGAGLMLFEVADLDADAVAVDALARLALAARRRGCRVRLVGASPELLQLVDFIGVADVLREGS